MERFKEVLRELRLEKEISQTQLAKSMGVSANTVSTWETGTRQPDYDTLARLASFFKVTTDYLLGLDKD